MEKIMHLSLTLVVTNLLLLSTAASCSEARAVETSTQTTRLVSIEASSAVTEPLSKQAPEVIRNTDDIPSTSSKHNIHIDSPASIALTPEHIESSRSSSQRTETRGSMTNKISHEARAAQTSPTTRSTTASAPPSTYSLAHTSETIPTSLPAASLAPETIFSTKTEASSLTSSTNNTSLAVTAPTTESTSTSVTAATTEVSSPSFPLPISETIKETNETSVNLFNENYPAKMAISLIEADMHGWLQLDKYSSAETLDVYRSFFSIEEITDYVNSDLEKMIDLGWRNYGFEGDLSNDGLSRCFVMWWSR